MIIAEARERTKCAHFSSQATSLMESFGSFSHRVDKRMNPVRNWRSNSNSDWTLSVTRWHEIEVKAQFVSVSLTSAECLVLVTCLRTGVTEENGLAVEDDDDDDHRFAWIWELTRATTNRCPFWWATVLVVDTEARNNLTALFRGSMVRLDCWRFKRNLVTLDRINGNENLCND